MVEKSLFRNIVVLTGRYACFDLKVNLADSLVLNTGERHIETEFG